MSTIKPLDKKRFSEQIAENIREKILDEKLETGHRLPTERALAEELSVSRGVVREAMRMLDASGFIDIKKGPRGGIFVNDVYHKPMSNSLRGLATHGRITVDHLFDVRLFIEPYMAAEAARSAKKSDVAALRALLADAEKHRDDPAYLKAKNIEFHLLLADASANPVLSILMRSITDILLEIAYDFLNPAFEKELFVVHKELLEAIAQHRVERARKLVREDILFVRRKLTESLRARDSS
jgi:GntR family transcriptional regulator, transcriptional repressor for pyruvate dehydrogenase complex